MPQDLPTPPWRVVYHDGSNNGFNVEQTAAGASISAAYDPVTPEQSSSGTYSGGAPWKGTLTADQAAGLWRRVRAMEGDRKLHQRNRTKGSGSFQLRSDGKERALLVSRCEKLADLDRFLEQLRK